MTEETAAFEFYYSIRSSFAYLAARRIAHLAHAHGRSLVHRPIDLQKLIAVNGGVTYDKVHAVRRHNHERNLERWARKLAIPVIVDPVHHVGPRERPSGLVILAQRQGGDADALAHEILAALWRDDRDIDDASVLADCCCRAGVDPALIDRALDPDVQEEMAENGRRALAAGVVGSPTFIVDGEPFFGQDLLPFVEEALKAGTARRRVA